MSKWELACTRCEGVCITGFSTRERYLRGCRLCECAASEASIRGTARDVYKVGLTTRYMKQ